MPKITTHEIEYNAGSSETSKRLQTQNLKDKKAQQTLQKTQETNKHLKPQRGLEKKMLSKKIDQFYGSDTTSQQNNTTFFEEMQEEYEKNQLDSDEELEEYPKRMQHMLDQAFSKIDKQKKDKEKGKALRKEQMNKKRAQSILEKYDT